MRLKDWFKPKFARFATALLALVATSATLPVGAAETTTITDPQGQSIEVYVVSDGFYQSAATYDSATDFFITSKAGLKYFRDWVNGTSAAMNNYYDEGFLTLSLASFASNNGMSGKRVHLLADIDLTGEVWQPIGPNSGSVSDKFASNWKAHFYGSFYGHGHVVSNVDTSQSDQGDKYSRWPQGFFGSISQGGPIDGLVLENVKAVSKFTYGYAGAIVGDLGSNPYTISNCEVRGKIVLTGGYSGAICGIGAANIVNCTVIADDGSTITGKSFAGGLVGAERGGSNLSISGNTVSGVEISSSQFAGALAGAMASGAGGQCSLTGNDVVDCVVNDNAAAQETLIDTNDGATATLTIVNNTVRTTVIIETGDLTPDAEVTEQTEEVNFVVPVTVKDRTGNIISETSAQEIAVTVSDEDIAGTKLTSVKLDEVVSKALEEVGEDATSVTAVEILVKASTESVGEVESIIYEVHPEAVVTVTKENEEPTTSTVALSNDALAEGETFTFRLDVTGLGVEVGGTVSVTHTSEGYPTETTLATVASDDGGTTKYVTVTTDHFSTWTLEGVTLQNDTVAIVFAANGSEIAQYTSVADAIAADTTVNGCTVLVLDGTHVCGDSTITIDKSITLAGQSKADTVLNFTATGKAAFSIAASNVTVKDMTINQANTNTDNTCHISIAAAGSDSCYSNVTLSNLRLEGGKYSVFVYGESFTIEGCDFASQGSSQILVDAIRGDSRIVNNTFTGGKYNINHRHSHTPTTVQSFGNLTISGNTSTNGNLFYILESASTIDTTKKITLSITGNKVVNYTNKAIAFTATDELGKYFNSVTITNNVFYTSAARPTIQRDDSDRSLEINAAYNYWGDKAPACFDSLIPGTPDKYLIMPHEDSNITYEPYYITYNAETGTLSDLRPLPKVAKIVRDNADFAQYETLAAAIAAAQDGDTIELLMDIELSGTEAVDINKVGNYVIDGKGHTISPAADSSYIYQRFKFGESGQAYDATRNYIVKNLTIEGFSNSTYFIRSEGCSVTFIDCVIENNTLGGQASSRLMLNTHANFTLDGCVIADNTSADSLIDFNSNASGDGTNAFSVNNCLFEGNVNGGVAVIQIAEDGEVSVADSTFQDNTVNATNNGAVVYLGDNECGINGGDCTGCLFKDNIINYTVSDVTTYGNRVRVAGAIFTWARGGNPGTISGNAFVNNSVVKQNANFLTCYAKAIYSGGYYNPQDLAGNYFGGSAPVIGQADKTTSNNDIYAEYASHAVVASTYAVSYTQNVDNYGVTVLVPVAKIERYGEDTQFFASLRDAVNAAADGDTIEMLADDRVSFANSAVRLYVTTSLTITGPVDENGEPIYSIYGDNEFNGLGFFFVTGPQDGTVTFSSLNIRQFGSLASLAQPAMHAPVYVAKANKAHIVLNNLRITEFNRTGVLLANGTFDVRDCYIDCTPMRTGSGSLAYGIDTHNLASGTILRTTIVNVRSEYDGWSAAAITPGGTAEINITDCNFVNCQFGVQTYNTGSEPNCTSTINLSGCVIDADDALRNDVAGAQIVVTDGTYKGVVSHRVSMGNPAPFSISGGSFSQYIADAYCAGGYLCTTKPMENGMYQVVPAKTVTFGDGDEAEVSGFACASISYPSGNPEATLLTTPTYTSDSKAFAGWKVNGEGDIIIAIPAGATANYTLFATWVGAKTVTITENSTDAEIKVTDEWIAQNVTKENPTEADIKATLETTDTNGLKKWENYVLGQDPSVPLAVGSEQSETVVMPVTNTLNVPTVDTGFDVQYSLDVVNASGSVVAPGTPQATTDFEIDLSDVTTTTYYKMKATITKDDATIATVESENTIGVMKVTGVPKVSIIAVPWKSLEDHQAIKVADLVRTANLTEGDELYVYDATAGKYRAWTLENGEWEAMTTSSGSGSAAAGDADTVTIERGRAVWLKRQNASEPVYLVGEVADASEGTPTASLDAKNGNDPSWNMVASPLPEPVAVSQVLGDSTTDKIIIPTAGAPKNVTRGSDGKYYYDDLEPVMVDNVQVGVRSVRRELTELPAGTGFWYLNNGDAKNINWSSAE